MLSRMQRRRSAYLEPFGTLVAPDWSRAQQAIEKVELVSLSAMGEIYPRLPLDIDAKHLESLVVPEKSYKTLKGLLAATGVDDGGALGCVSGVPGQAFAPCVSAVLLPAVVH